MAVVLNSLVLRFLMKMHCIHFKDKFTGATLHGDALANHKIGLMNPVEVEELIKNEKL